MAGDQPNPSPGGTPQDATPGQQGGAAAEQRPGVDPAALADQATQLAGAPIPAQAAGPVPPPPAAPPTAPPAGAPAPPPGAPADVSYQPTAPAFPAQAPPPAGGYGAPVGPYDPQAGSAYAYPQAAPAPAPGPYGPPQPGYPQPDQGGYAYPGPPQPDQGGYAYPGPPPQQGGYAYPGPPMPAPAPAKQRNPVLVFGAVAGSVLVVGIVIGLVVLFGGGKSSGNTAAGGGGNNPPAAQAGKFSATWTAPKSDDDGSDSQTLGTWTTDKLLVRGDATGLTAYDLSDGKVAWTLAVPPNAKAFCSMSATVNKNMIGGVSFNLGDDDCAAVGAVDATSGKLLFKVGQSIPNNTSFNTQVTVTDTTLAAASGAIQEGFSLTDGSTVWQWKDRGQFCNDSADTAGGVLVVSDYCADATPSQVLSVLDANTGKVETNFNLNTQGERIGAIISVKPLVLQISNGGDNDFVVGLDGANNAMAQIPLKVTGQDTLQLTDANAGLSHDIVLGNTLYVEVGESSKTAVRAIDLVSGRTLWTVDGGTDEGLRLAASATSDGKPLAIAMQGYGKASQLVSLSPVDGSVTTIAPFANTQDSSLPFQDAQVLVPSTGQVITVPQSPMDNSAQLYTKG
ncbi:PQQ-binding-like beta-propeller repeat protein [Kitasatospora sp. NPDC052896]|uniref:outer membrane protein assembly factor BamB family protein n=1 Tax=Kitasatospora sp. NPDC052896 TaxID=3364061 RepID=UPI0037C8050A